MEFAGNVLRTADFFIERQAADQYNHALTTMNTGLSDFVRSIEKDPDYSSYEKKFETYQAELQSQISQSMTNVRAQKRFETDWSAATQRARGMVLDIADVKSLEVLEQNLRRDISTVISTQPLGSQDPRERRISQDVRLTRLVTNAMQAGLSPALGEALLADAKAKSMYADARDLMNQATRTLTSKGLSSTEISDILDQTIRLEGDAYNTFVKAQAEKNPELQQMFDAYRLINLLPNDEEKLVTNTRNEAIFLGQRQRQDHAEAKTQYYESFYKQWFSDDWMSLAEDDYQAIWSSPLEASEKASLVQSIETRIDTAKQEEEQLAADLAEADAQQRRENALAAYTKEIDEIAAAPGDDAKTLLDEIRTRVRRDKDLTDTQRNAKIHDIEAILKDMEAAQKGRAAAEAEALEEQEKLAAEAQEAVDEAEYARKLRNYDEAVFRLEQNPMQGGYDSLVSRLLADTMDDSDRDEILTALRRIKGELPTPEEIAEEEHDYEADVFRDFYNDRMTPEQVEQSIRNYQAAGHITPEEAQRWMARIPKREELLRNPVISGAIRTIDQYFNSQLRAIDVSAEDRIMLSKEWGFATRALQGDINNPEIRQLPEDEQRRKYDDLVAFLLKKPTANFVAKAFGIGGEVAIASARNLKAKFAEGASDELLNAIAIEVARDWREEYDKEEVGPDQVRYVRVGDEAVYYHEASGYFFTQHRNIVGAYRWKYARPEDVEKNSEGKIVDIDWRDWSARRLRDLNRQYPRNE